MLLPALTQRIWLYALAVDMRKSYAGLIALVMHHLREDPTSGELFIFINRRKTHLKALYFETGGYCLWCKRLEQGQFNFSQSSSAKQLLNWQELQGLIDGIEVQKVRQYKRYNHNINAETKGVFC